MSYPALEHALDHYRDVGPRAVNVLRYLRKRLAFHEYRPVKVLAVAADMKLHRRNVGHDLQTLVRLGYLLRGPKAYHGGPYTYQLVWSVNVQDMTPSQAA